MSTFTDDFSGGAAALDGRTFSGGGATWDQVLGAAMVTDGSGNCTIPSTGGDNTAVASADCSGDDTCCELDFSGFTGVTSWFVWIDISSNAAGSSGYELGFGHDGSVTLYRINGGAYDVLDTDTWTPGAGTFRLERKHSTGDVNGYFNGALKVTAANDAEATGAGNRKAAAGGFTNVGATVTFASFTYADISGGGGGGTPTKGRLSLLGVGV